MSYRLEDDLLGYTQTESGKFEIGSLSSHAVLGDVAIAQVDFVYLMTQLDAMGILLREDNFKMYSRSRLEKMVLSLKSEFEKYVSNIV